MPSPPSTRHTFGANSGPRPRRSTAAPSELARGLSLTSVMRKYLPDRPVLIRPAAEIHAPLLARPRPRQRLPRARGGRPALTPALRARAVRPPRGRRQRRRPGAGAPRDGADRACASTTPTAATPRRAATGCGSTRTGWSAAGRRRRTFTVWTRGRRGAVLVRGDGCAWRWGGARAGAPRGLVGRADHPVDVGNPHAVVLGDARGLGARRGRALSTRWGADNVQFAITGDRPRCARACGSAARAGRCRADRARARSPPRASPPDGSRRPSRS